MVTDYGELPEANRQVFETHLEDLRQKMASCYRKMRQGVIKQQEFLLPVYTTSKKTFSSTFEKTLEARINELENRLNSRLLGSASTSYNSEHLYGVSPAYNLPSVPIQQNWSMISIYNPLNAIDPKIIPAAQYAGQTDATLPVRPDMVAGPTGGTMPIGLQSVSLLGSVPASAVPSNPMTSTRPKPKSLSDEIAEAYKNAFKNAFGVNTRIKKDSVQESKQKKPRSHKRLSLILPMTM
uniref:Uncharacterized protein n=1 Tax=Oryza punctata TaxID=4537 RepID=A0A0E0MF89_ORYPU